METLNKKIISRPPVVVVMGHIDHGKSTLLDYIRKTNTTDKEAGGITQHVSAYEAVCEVDGQNRKITFLDTPGHEAFGAIRERGASIADIAVLVVSVEDGVKPQTLEALNWIKKSGTPFIVALTKIDRAPNNIDKVKQNLAEHEVLVEGWGGSVPLAAVSGKTGEGVPELLELITLQADLEELTGDLELPAEGLVIESEVNPKQGISATLIIKNGTLHIGNFVATAGAYAPVRSIENFKGENVSEASFSSPARIIGWSDIPRVGGQFKVFTKKDEASLFADQATEQAHEAGPAATTFWETVIKTDTYGSLDAVEHELRKLGDEKIAVKIISKGIGAISENDIKTASIKKCPVLGFNVAVDRSAEALALRDNNIEIKTFKIIYELVDYVKAKMKEAAPVETVEVVTGQAKVLKTFSKTHDKQVIGGRMEEGEITVGASVQIFRRDANLGSGKIKELQLQKIKTGSIKESQEFGMLAESKIEIMPGDLLKVISLIKQ